MRIENKQKQKLRKTEIESKKGGRREGGKKKQELKCEKEETKRLW